MTFAQRALRFLTSRKNIGASVLALIGAAVAVFASIPAVIAVPLVVALYAVGYFVIRPEQGIKLTFFDERDAQQIRQGLNDLTYSLRFRVSDDVLAAVEDASRAIQLTMPVEGATGLSAIDPSVMLIRQTALHYLPQALEAYLALPRIYAERVPVQDGKTAKDVLIEQLRLIEQKMKETSQAMFQNDADRLLANARFLQDRFARSAFDTAPVVDLGAGTHSDPWKPR